MRRVRRTILRRLLGLHADNLCDLIERLGHGASPAKVLAAWKKECGAVRDVESLFKTHLAQAHRKAGRS